MTSRGAQSHVPLSSQHSPHKSSWTESAIFHLPSVAASSFGVLFSPTFATAASAEPFASTSSYTAHLPAALKHDASDASDSDAARAVDEHRSDIRRRHSRLYAGVQFRCAVCNDRALGYFLCLFRTNRVSGQISGLKILPFKGQIISLRSSLEAQTSCNSHVFNSSMHNIAIRWSTERL